MSMCAIEQSGFVMTKYLQGTSTDAPVKKKKKSCGHSQPQRLTSKGQHKLSGSKTATTKLILKRQLALFAEKGVHQEHINELFGLVSSGHTYKSAKATITPSSGINLYLLPFPWVPTTVILEGMFIIQTEPFSTIETRDEYKC